MAYSSRKNCTLFKRIVYTFSLVSKGNLIQQLSSACLKNSTLDLLDWYVGVRRWPKAVFLVSLIMTTIFAAVIPSQVMGTYRSVTMAEMVVSPWWLCSIEQLSTGGQPVSLHALSCVLLSQVRFQTWFPTRRSGERVPKVGSMSTWLLTAG